MKHCRRVSVALALIGAAFCIRLLGQSDIQEFRVTLLGTGSVAPVMDRFGPGILVEAGRERLLFDAGRGVLQRLQQTNARDVSRLFLTHLHSDHIVGIPDLYLIGWGSRRESPLQVWGPTGTAAMMSHLKDAFTFDREIRVQVDGRRVRWRAWSAG